MLGVIDGLVEQHRDMAVERGVRHCPPGPLPGDQAEMTQHPQLVGDRGLLHPDIGGQLTDGRRALAQRPRMRSLLGVASACMVAATAVAVCSSMRAAGVERPRTPCPMIGRLSSMYT